jgi:hypothetical protein
MLPPTGRLIVILFQWEISGQKQEGFLRMQRQALDFVRGIESGDSVAVLLFSSRLWLRQDFTADERKLEAALRGILRSDENRTPDPASDVSLLKGLTAEEASSSQSIEKALLAIGHALAPLPGKKSMLLLGWGIGKWTPTFRNQRDGYVRQTVDYGPARKALVRAEVSVFCLDVSDGSHPLAAGLERVAWDTGGFYVPTNLFPEFAMRKVERALSGHYILVFVKPASHSGEHRIEIHLASRTGTVFCRGSYEDTGEPNR